MNQYKPTNDYIFKRIFGQKRNSDILKNLLSAILPQIDIKEIEVGQEINLEKELMQGKLGKLDILATLDSGTKVDIEMQVKNQKNTIERSLFYDAGLIQESIKEAENYIDIPQIIGIWILNYDLFEEGPIHEIARIKRDYKGIILTDIMELHYIQLPKFRKNSKSVSKELREWLTFIENENLEEIAMSKNEYIKKAEQELEYLNGNAYERRLAFLRNVAILDANTEKKAAKMEGLEEGKKEGMAKGIEKGKKEGKKNEKIQTAKRMLKKGIDIQTIIEITELTKEEIENLEK